MKTESLNFFLFAEILFLLILKTEIQLFTEFYGPKKPYFSQKSVFHSNKVAVSNFSVFQNQLFLFSILFQSYFTKIVRNSIFLTGRRNVFCTFLGLVLGGPKWEMLHDLNLFNRWKVILGQFQTHSSFKIIVLPFKKIEFLMFFTLCDNHAGFFLTFLQTFEGSDNLNAAVIQKLEATRKRKKVI